MNGHIIPGTPIAVDFWKKRDCPSAKFFFLSHLHGDHTVGLSSSWQYNIYCSEITSKLLIGKYHIKDDLVVVLETGRSHIIYLDEEKQEQMVVSVIDANHCPGSVMFLFEGYFGKVFYTGDFRYSESMFVDIPLSESSNVDILYLDNTYCTPDCVFPSREHATEMILSLIQQYTDHRILVGMRNLGKEELLVKIAEKTQEWISVSSSMYRTAEILGLPNVFCVDDMDCRIRVVPVHTVTRSNVLGWNDYEPTLAIVPSALYTGLGCSPYADCPNIHVIPYSDHSNFEEICTFVNRLKPKLIQPIVNERPRGGIFGKFAERSDMSCLDKFLSNESTVKVTIPPTVKKFMSISMTTYMKKVSTQKKQGIKTLRVKKKKQASLGVVFDSPGKSQEDISAQEFERQLENMRRSFKPVPESKKSLVTCSSDCKSKNVINTGKTTNEGHDMGDNKIEESRFTDSKSVDSADKGQRTHVSEYCPSDGMIQSNQVLKAEDASTPLTLSDGRNDKASINSDASGCIDIENYSSESEGEDVCVDTPRCGAQIKSGLRERGNKLNESSKTKSNNISVARPTCNKYNTDEDYVRPRSHKSSQGQLKIDSWFHSALKAKHCPDTQKVCTQPQNTTLLETDPDIDKRSRNEVKSGTSSFKKKISTPDQIRSIPLKPMKMKRCLSSEFNVFPIKRFQSVGKRPSCEDLIIQPLKKRKSSV